VTGPDDLRTRFARHTVVALLDPLTPGELDLLDRALSRITEN
jgi:hypothetical protein